MKTLKTIAGIDTVEVTAENYIDRRFDFITHDTTRRITTDADIQKYKYRLNPDKNVGFDTSYFDGYKFCIDDMFRKAQFKRPVKTRIDFRFDNYDTEYKDCYKVNKLLLLLIATKYKVKNTYQSIDMLTAEQKTIRIQTKYFEVEFYNKQIEEPESSIKTRLELRSKALYNDYSEAEEQEKEIKQLDLWVKRLTGICDADLLNTVTDRLNAHLIERYSELKAQRKINNIAEFVTKYDDFFFTRKQLVSFYSSIGIEYPEQTATNYKRNHKIEFFSLRELRNYVGDILASVYLFCGVVDKVA